MYIDLLDSFKQKAVISSAWEEIAFDWITLNLQ